MWWQQSLSGFWLGISLAGAIILLPTVTIALDESATNDWAQSTVARLIRPSDAASRSLESSAVQFSTIRVKVRTGDTIESLLKEQGVLPDTESFGAVYTLNPGIDPASITPGSDLLLPQLKGGDLFMNARQEGFLVALTLQVDQKRHIIERIARLDLLAKRFSSLRSDRFSGPADRSRAIVDINNSLSFLRSLEIIIRGQTRPLDPEMLWQVGMESGRLESIITSVLSRNSVPSDEELRVIHSIGQSMETRALQFRKVRGPGEPPEKYAQVYLLVKALERDGREAHGLRVYYAPEALYGLKDAARPFATLTSPTTRYLPEANYRIWALRPGQTEPATEVLSLAPRVASHGTNMVVELLVIH